ncbi:MAG: ATP-binding protein [Acidimicrobiia bacterium]|jgi:ABC-type branched-subunit amino acid transport system ATPase component/predicted MFS family arabinose efflux permease
MPDAPTESSAPNAGAPSTSTAATLTAVVVAEEEARREAQAAAEAGELLPDDLLPGVGGAPMPLRDGLRAGGMAMIIALLLVNIIETFDQVALQVLAPDVQKTLDVSKTTLQGLSSLGGVVLVVATLPFAWLADRYFRTRILAVATLVWSACMVATGLVVNPLTMGFARAGAGFGAAAKIPISPSLIADQYPIGVRTRMFAFENLGRPLGLVIGPFFVGAVAAQVSGTEGWRWAMVAIAIPAVFIGLALLFLREPGRGRNEQEAVLGRVLDTDDEPPVRLSSVAARLKKVKTFRYLTLGIGMLGFALVSVPVRLSFLFEETYDFGAYKRGWVLSLTYIPALIVIPIAGRYGDRLFRRDPRWAVRLFGWLVVAYGVFLTVGTQLGAVELLIFFVAIANACQLAAFTQIGPTISAVVPYRMRAQAFALIGFYIFLLGGFFGGLMVAAVADAYGERTAILVVVPMAALLGGFLVMRGAKFMKRDISLVVEELLDEQEEQRRIAANPDDVPVLQVHNLDTSYGPVQILFDVNLEVRRGEVLALLGTNGAGKSTLLKTISGLVIPDRGVVRMNGHTITLTDPEIRVAMGMIQVPGGECIFPSQTVAENLEVWSWLIEDRAKRQGRIEAALETFPALKDRMKSRAGSLSGGQQQMLAVCKAVMLEPELLLIDELSLGLAPLVVQELLEVVEGLRATGVTMVIVEQSVNVALAIADRAIFMERGRVRFEGPANELLERDDLLRAVFLSGEGA